MIRLLTFLTIFSLVAGSLAAAAAAAAGKTAADNTEHLPDGVDIPMLGAGQADHTGWYPATSQTKRFQIHFPVPYDEWSASLDNTQSATHSLSATSQEEIKFLVTEFIRSDDKEFSSPMRLTEAFTQNKRRVNLRHVRYENIAGTQFMTISDKSATVYRLLMTDQYVYLLSIEYPNKQKTLAKRLAPLFFNSFMLENP